MRYQASFICENAHLTEVEMIRPVLHDDGTVEGFMGSSADYCDVCDSSEMTIMGVKEVTQ